MKLTPEQIVRIYPTQGNTYIGKTWYKPNRVQIDEKQYLTFEPYHIIGCTLYDNALSKWRNRISGFYFDDNMILHKFRIEFPEKLYDYYWKENFVKNTMKTKVIICDTKFIKPQIKDTKPVKLICDPLSLAHTHAYSVANNLIRSKDKRTYEKFAELYSNYDKFNAFKHTMKSYSSDFVLNIKTPKFERTPDNKNTKTFDRIRCIISLRSFENDTKIDFDKLTDYVKNDIDAIFNDTLDVIENCKGWQKYDIPINVLACTYARVCLDYTLELIFEIKELNGEKG